VPISIRPSKTGSDRECRCVSIFRVLIPRLERPGGGERSLGGWKMRGSGMGGGVEMMGSRRWSPGSFRIRCAWFDSASMSSTSSIRTLWRQREFAFRILVFTFGLEFPSPSGGPRLSPLTELEDDSESSSVRFSLLPWKGSRALATAAREASLLSGWRVLDAGPHRLASVLP
jgi:hypothetical protein